MNVSANISAMQTAVYGFGVSSHNVANLSTDGFKSQEVVNTVGVDGGPRPVVEQTESGTDVVTEMTRQQRLMYDFKANAKVVKMHDEMIGSLINTLA